MAAVAPPPAPAPAAPAAPAPATVPVADQTTDLLQKLSLDSQPKAADATEPAAAAAAAKKQGAVTSQPLSVAIPPERSITPVLQDFMDPNLFYLPAYYYGGYDSSMSEWDDYPRYLNSDGVEIAPAAVYGDIYGYGYAPYGAYSPATSPVPTVDGQMFGAQHYQYPATYFQPPTPVPSTTQSDLQSSNNPEKPAAKADPAKTTANGVPNGTAHSNSGTVPIASSQQNSSLTPDGTYRAPLLGGVPSAGYLDTTYGYDSAHFAWYDGSAYTNGQQRTTTTNHYPSSTFSGNGSSARNQNKSSTTQQMGMQNRRPTTTSAAPTYTNRMYPSSRPYTQYGNSIKTGLPYGSNGYDSRIYGQWGIGMDNRYRPRGRNGYYGYGNESQDGTIELNRGPRSGRFKNQKLYGHTVTIAVKEQTLPSGETKNDSAVPDRTQFNRDDFPAQYDAAKFFVIKSYSEDDIHKSVKYNVWASTTNGNKKLDAAYQEAQSKGSGCHIFLFFSVNTSGQFVGVAEMTGAVDFEKTLEYWQQDKWNGSFSVKWHIVKDVPNNILKHIILENNENKPVTNSRDTQEIHLEQGLQMLKIFKDHVSKTSILDDFAFYESRQKLMQDKRSKQQQVQKQVWDSRTPISFTSEQQQEAANGKPNLSDVPNGVTAEVKATSEKPVLANGVAKGVTTTPAEVKAVKATSEKPVLANGVAKGITTTPAVSYAAKVAQTATEKPVLANGVAKTG